MSRKGDYSQEVSVLIMASMFWFRFIQKQGGTLTEAKAINLVLFPLLKSLQYLHSQVG